MYNFRSKSINEIMLFSVILSLNFAFFAGLIYLGFNTGWEIEISFDYFFKVGLIHLTIGAFVWNVSIQTKKFFMPIYVVLFSLSVYFLRSLVELQTIYDNIVLAVAAIVCMVGGGLIFDFTAKRLNKLV